MRCFTRAARPATRGVARLVPSRFRVAPERTTTGTLSTPTTSGFTTVPAELAGNGPRPLVLWMVVVVLAGAAPTVTAPAFVVSPGLVSEYPLTQCSMLRTPLPAASMMTWTQSGVTPGSRSMTSQ